MGLFGNKIGGIMDEIRCDEQSYIIWKWHPKNAIPGNNNRENAIRWGSSISVKDGSAAIFVHTEDGEFYQDVIPGPFQSRIETDNLPIIAGLIGLAYDGGTPFQSEVYFVNMASIIQIRYGIQYFDVFDPRFEDYSVPVAVRGTASFHITNCKNFVALHRLDNFSIEDFKNQTKDAVSRYVKEIVTNLPAQMEIPVVQIERKIGEINSILKEEIAKRFETDFGVTVTGFDISDIEIDKTSDSYARLMAVTRDVSEETIKAQKDINIKEMKDSQAISVLEREGKAVADIEENKYAKHKQTQTKNFDAYKIEVSEHVGVAGAEGIVQ